MSMKFTFAICGNKVRVLEADKWTIVYWESQWFLSDKIALMAVS